MGSDSGESRDGSEDEEPQSGIRKAQAEWCRELRKHLMDQYEKLKEARNSLGNVQDQILKDSKWLLDLETRIKKIMEQKRQSSEDYPNMDFLNCAEPQ